MGRIGLDEGKRKGREEKVREVIQTWRGCRCDSYNHAIKDAAQYLKRTLECNINRSD